MQVKKIRKVMLEADKIEGFNIDATHWFESISKKIDILKEIEEEISFNLRIEDIELFERMKVAVRFSDLLHGSQLEVVASSGYISALKEKI